MTNVKFLSYLLFLQILGLYTVSAGIIKTRSFDNERLKTILDLTLQSRPPRPPSKENTIEIRPTPQAATAQPTMKPRPNLQLPNILPSMLPNLLPNILANLRPTAQHNRPVSYPQYLSYLPLPITSAILAQRPLTNPQEPFVDLKPVYVPYPALEKPSITEKPVAPNSSNYYTGLPATMQQPHHYYQQQSHNSLAPTSHQPSRYSHRPDNSNSYSLSAPSVIIVNPANYATNYQRDTQHKRQNAVDARQIEELLYRVEEPEEATEREDNFSETSDSMEEIYDLDDNAALQPIYLTTQNVANNGMDKMDSIILEPQRELANSNALLEYLLRNQLNHSLQERIASIYARDRYDHQRQ